ncbi:hypothetical protein [Mycobacterium sp.]|uniref:hypothetical protein n=1 Tax=Mycobacterium sp. TaxID=1785 RepID=UPI003D1345B1
MPNLHTWDGWQLALARRFLRPNLVEDPVIFFVDDVELTGIDGDGARARLVSVVAAELQAADSPYGVMLARAAGWTPDATDQPPTLPLLAVTVLAATDMQASAGVSSQDYYTRLTQLLAPDGNQATWRKALEAHFPDVAAAWRDLHQWIIGPGGRTSTIVETPYPAYIGYPLSQALIRRSDQDALTLFWERAGLEPGDDQPAGSELLRDLREWMKPYRGFTKPFQKTVATVTGKVGQLFQELLRQAARDWDGRVRDRTGRVLPRCRLSAWEDGHVAQLEWLIGPPEDPDELSVSPFQQADLLKGFRDAGGAQIHPAAPVIVMRFDSALQRWAEVTDFRLNQEHALIWNSDLWAQTAQEFVTSSYNGSFNMIRLVPGSPKIRGAFGIFFTKSNVLEAALSKAALKGLVFESQQRPRLALVDGLKISNALGKRVYVIGGAADLVLPAGNPGQMVDVALDGSVTTFRRSGLSFPLKPFGLEPGWYGISADETTLHFEVTDEPEKTLGRPDAQVIARKLTPQGVALDASGETDAIRVRGGLIINPDGRPRPDPWDIFAIARRQMMATYLLGPKGHIRKVTEPARTDLWTLVGGPSEPLTFSVSVRPTEYWMVQVGATRTLVESVGGTRSRAFSDASPNTDVSLWRMIIAQAAESSSSPEWRAFVAQSKAQW